MSFGRPPETGPTFDPYDQTGSWSAGGPMPTPPAYGEQSWPGPGFASAPVPTYPSRPAVPGRDLSVPGDHPAPAAPVAAVPATQRPGVIAVAANLAITASLLFLVLLAFGLLLAVSVRSTFSVTSQPEASIYHLAERFQLALLEGLAVPLFAFPVASVVTGFLLLVRRPWARIVHTLLGVAALAWSFWWLRSDLAWWVPTSAYIVLGLMILWTPSVGRWYATRPGAVPAPAWPRSEDWPPAGR